MAAPAAATVVMGKGGAVAILLVVLYVDDIPRTKSVLTYFVKHGRDFGFKCGAHSGLESIVGRSMHFG